MKEIDLFTLWLNKATEDSELKKELLLIKDDSAAIEDRFYCELEFGTGGLRGILGAGTNRMNIYTVAKATQGLSNFLKSKITVPKVAIAYDSRINSKLFAETAARVFAANGVSVLIYPVLMPTPSLSFAVRDLKCDGGVVITASHNPGKYNGYKVYGSDGCQITTEAAKYIQHEINMVDPFEDVKWASFEDMLSKERIQYIGEDTVTRYLNAVSSESVLPPNVKRDVKIVYTPLNGAGISCVPRCLRENGFRNIILVDEQKMPDGNFPSCPYPNPEIREALEVGLQWAQKTGSDLLLATDPDCDRVGVAVKDKGNYALITGNQMGVLLLDFICKMRKEQNKMPENPVAVKTIVTTPMAARVAEYHGVQLIDVLTGFKFIGEQIGLLDKNGESERYIFGFEESYGYLSGSFVRDKDAVNACLLICEMFAFYKAKGKSLLDVLDELYEMFGFYESRLLTYTFEGSSGFAKMQKLLSNLRDCAKEDIAGIDVVKTVDYMNDDTGLPRSNVMRYLLKGNLEAVIRPSGTEPKLKIYLTICAETQNLCAELGDKLEKYFNTWVRE